MTDSKESDGDIKRRGMLQLLGLSARGRLHGSGLHQPRAGRRPGPPGTRATRTTRPSQATRPTRNTRPTRVSRPSQWTSETSRTFAFTPLRLPVRFRRRERSAAGAAFHALPPAGRRARVSEPEERRVPPGRHAGERRVFA